MEKIKWHHKIAFRLFAVTFFILLFPLLLFWNYAQRSAMQTLRERQAGGIQRSLYGASLIMQSAMDQISDYTRNICRDTQLQQAASDYQAAAKAGQETERARSRISLLLNEYVGQSSALEALCLYFPDSRRIVSMLPDKKEILADEDYSEYFYDVYYNRMEASLEYRIMLSPLGSKSLTQLRPMENGDNFLLIAVIRDSVWRDMLSFFHSDAGEWLITDYSGSILYGTNGGSEVRGIVDTGGIYQEAFQDITGSGSYQWKKDGDDSLVVYYNSVESALKYVMSEPAGSVMGYGSLQPEFYILISVSAVLSLLIGNLILNQSLVQPINLLRSYMNASRNGKMEQVPVHSRKDEPGALFDCYNAMVVRQQELMNEVNIRQLLQKQAQLNYLQSQMDEHFLFNTLNTIYGEACHEKAAHSARMILVLSQYFRLSLSYGKEKLPLNEIEELLRLYIQLQRMRFGNNLICKIDTFPGMEQYAALKYLFQPLVENAIVHGFEKNPAGHTIHIRFWTEQESVHFCVQDDGVGMEAEALEELRRRVNSRDEGGDAGFALRSIHEQLCLAYGEREIELKGEPGHGMCVGFSIPLERIGDAE